MLIAEALEALAALLLGKFQKRQSLWGKFPQQRGLAP